MKKILLRILLGIAILIAALVIFIFTSWDKNFDAPLPEIKASTDSAIIARGKYLAFGPAHCATCHVPKDKIRDVENGEQMPLSGGWEITIPPGTFHAPNLTPDMETGIGKVSDGQLARALRHLIRDNGKVMFPFMPFQELSDADVTALISFLRSQPAVKHEVPHNEYTFLGKALMAFGVIKPSAPKQEPPKTVNIDSTATYGDYVTHRVANCVGCHTNRDLKTGEFIGVPFAGGLHFDGGVDKFTEDYGFTTPNLTPDKETGVMAEWTETAFVNRFRAGRAVRQSPMPWGAFSRMNDVELKAIYRYLRTLKPESNKIAQTIFPPVVK